MTDKDLAGCFRELQVQGQVSGVNYLKGADFCFLRMEASQAPPTITVVDAQILYVTVILPYALDEDAMRK